MQRQIAYYLWQEAVNGLYQENDPTLLASFDVSSDVSSLLFSGKLNIYCRNVGGCHFFI